MKSLVRDVKQAGFQDGIRSRPDASRRSVPVAALFVIGFVILLGGASISSAENVLRMGADGEAGMPGMEGAPGETGGRGVDGETVTASASAPPAGFASNVAVAVGGQGGAGGQGGDATLNSGENGGQGGAGGDGGDATAIATLTGRGSLGLRAVATGGSAGQVGAGGLGSAPGVDGAAGARIGSGGDAIASATTIDGDGKFGSIRDAAVAVGGNGSGGLDSRAGNATATIVGEYEGGTMPTYMEASATGGSGGITGGDAYAEAAGQMTNGALFVSAEAQTGSLLLDSSSSQGPVVRLTDATAIASGVVGGGDQAGFETLRVEATALTPSFFSSATADPTSGRKQAIASGTATSGADVRVSATVAGGREVDVRNAVSGSTAGRLELTQAALSSDEQSLLTFDIPLSGLGRFQAVGATRTGLVTENAGGGDLVMKVFATGAIRSLGEARDVDVILGDIRGSSVTGAEVDIAVTATGGRIVQENLDDENTRSQIQGISNGGDVSVVADFQGVQIFGTQGIVGNQLTAPDGADLRMINAVDGDTTGNLLLVQRATGMPGAFIQPRSDTTPPGTSIAPPDGGDVINRLSKSGSFESLSLNATSRGGSAGNSLVTSRSLGSRGGSAVTSLVGENDSGGVRLTGNALGGATFPNKLSTSRGSDATLDFKATTFGDGNEIIVGNQSPIEFDPTTGRATATHGAFAGHGSSVRQLEEGRTGDGGNAASRSAGIAYGDSEVSVFDFARGGAAGVGFAREGIVTSGSGGDAVSSATAEGGGSSQVIAQSTAVGGFGNRFARQGGRGGDAFSNAYAKGLGIASAQALAVGGEDSMRAALPGSARAVAESVGGIGTATADARAGGGELRAMITRTTPGQTRFVSVAGYGTLSSTRLFDLDGSALITGKPLTSDVDAFASRQPVLSEFLSANPRSTVEALARWDVWGDRLEQTTQLVELDISLATPEDGRDLALVFAALGSADDDFDRMTFQLEVGGVAFGGEAQFDDLAEATTYFSTLFVLGQAYRDAIANLDGPAVRAIFEVSTLAGKNVAFGLAALVVPEPSTALLLGLGIIILAIWPRLGGEAMAH